MDSELTTAQLCIEAAMQALKTGDRRAARHNAQRAAALAPQLEQPWLLLAFLASPGAAEYFLDRALQVNPNSQQALAGKNWLKTQSGQSVPMAGFTPPDPPPPAGPRRAGASRRRSLRFLGWVVVLLALVGGLAILSGATRLADSRNTALMGGSPVLQKEEPTLESSPTPSLTWTAPPTETATPTPTLTGTASPIPTGTASPVPASTSTATPEPTATPTSAPTANQQPSPTQVTNTPVRNTTYSVVPGDTLALIAQRFSVSLQALIAANNLANPSFIQAGQVLTIPAGGLPPVTFQPTVAAIPTGKTGKGKEILVDISEQHLYAYEDNKLVFSLVVSTGIGNSTRVGVFKVLDKIPRAYSSRFNIWMPWWMGIYYSGTLENGIHGLPLLMNGVELWGNLLGKPATYGCVESKTSEAKLLYDWAEIGTPVIIQR